ncbi:phosphomevalonate kinase [Mycetocola reblochoni]|uniref:phosphomevalonate kinase n=2 Tax=Mycetocola reblochoni TaxID=331618 RepID=A0A1R4IWJ7_9MICO|nr:phosphomevalonate kinase [Mycetocola reblochoni]RLP70953.1 phosphomevalonate kinase [Mycetocola reblochoni]SJN24240.1 Phosphomevalonate kinase [Mycetocola reblochoni REB411]
MIRVSAPGKLFIAGEYAVVETGQPAVLVAVDRYLTVELQPATGEGRLISDQYGRLPVLWRRAGSRLVLDTDQRPFDYVLEAISAVESYATESGHPLGYYDLTISSELDDMSGRKFGLGSSAAVTAATVQALDRFYDLGLSRLELLKLAYLATMRVNANGSGGDLAASMFGGWIAYTAFDRAWVADNRERMSTVEMVRSEWPGLSVRAITPPSALQLIVGWTGVPASTMSLVSSVQDRKSTTNSHYGEFLSQSRACVEELVAAFEADDAVVAQRQIRQARRLLQRLSAESELVIETPALRLLCDSAGRAGGAAKSSGAGGGDCGIVLIDTGIDVRPMLREWELNDIRHLAIGVHPAER